MAKLPKKVDRLTPCQVGCWVGGIYIEDLDEWRGDFIATTKELRQWALQEQDDFRVAMLTDELAEVAWWFDDWLKWKRAEVGSDE